MQLSIGNIREQDQEKYWSSRANTYGKQYGLERDSVKLKIERKVNILKRYVDFTDKKIIECGCGTGLYTKEFSKLSNKFLATDISMPMIEVAKQYNPDVKFEMMDARRLPIDDERYDVVVSAFLLQHVEISLVLSEMYRVLKYDGIMCAFVPNILNPLHLSRARIEFMRKILHENSHSIDLTRWEWVRTLNSYRFKTLVVKPIGFISPYTPYRLMPLSIKTLSVLEYIPLIKEFAGTLLIIARK